MMLSKKATIICLLIHAALLTAAGHAGAQTLASARILSDSGPVEIHRPSRAKGMLTQISYHVNDELFAGDVIRTLKGGRLVLGLVDGSQAIIGELTVLEILDLSKSPRAIFNVLRGKTRVKIEKVGGRPNPYRVNTPTTVIAVRGTVFDVFVTSKETQVFVHEGEVSVTNVSKPDVMIILAPGERTRVLPAQAPEPPSRFQPGRNDDKFNPVRSGQDRQGGPRPTGGTGGQTDSDRRRQTNPFPADSKSPEQKPPGEMQKQDASPQGKPNSRRQDSGRGAEQFFANHG
jgi:hypothetical protein